jgi:hypothetical protein
MLRSLFAWLSEAPDASPFLFLSLPGQPHSLRFEPPSTSNKVSPKSHTPVVRARRDAHRLRGDVNPGLSAHRSWHRGGGAVKGSGCTAATSARPWASAASPVTTAGSCAKDLACTSASTMCG